VVAIDSVHGRDGHKRGEIMIAFLRVAIFSMVCLWSLAAGIAPSSAADYPNRPVRWLIGFAAGGPVDTVARIMAQSLSERLGQQFIVENRAGSGGNIATEAGIGATPDGYTLLFSGANNAISASLYKKLPFDFIRDTMPVAGLCRCPICSWCRMRCRSRPFGS
jgi:tripartite-type tricarboxylate transporter receptor subunit TctC